MHKSHQDIFAICKKIFSLRSEANKKLTLKENFPDLSNYVDEILYSESPKEMANKVETLLSAGQTTEIKIPRPKEQTNTEYSAIDPSVYPYLVNWKKEGLNKLPKLSLEVISQEAKKVIEKFEPQLRKIFREMFNKSIYMRFGVESPEHLRLIEDECMPTATQLVYWFMEDWGDKEENKKQDFLNAGLEIKNRAPRGKDKVSAGRNLINLLLPSTKGGPSIPNKDHKAILKRNHLELQKCIKEVREKCEIPLKEDNQFLWESADKSETIMDTIPNWDIIFDKSELPMITKYSSVAQVSLEIIAKRCDLSPHTLQNIFDKVTPM